MSKKKTLILPKLHYGPFFLKILKEFIEFHKLPSNLYLPDNFTPSDVVLSRILDIMVHTFGNERREEILKELDEFNMTLPAFFRN